MRLHRTLKHLVGSVDPVRVANRAEYYLEGARVLGADIKGIGGLVSKDRIKNMVRKVDGLEREIARLEEKIERVAERRRMEALKLDDCILQNMDVLGDYLEEDELAEFR